MTEKGKYPETWSEVFANNFNNLSKQITELDSRIRKLESLESEIDIDALVREYCDKRCLVMIPRETLIKLIGM